MFCLLDCACGLLFGTPLRVACRLCLFKWCWCYVVICRIDSMCTHTHTRTHTHTHTHTHARTRTRTRTYAHIRTHSHTNTNAKYGCPALVHSYTFTRLYIACAAVDTPQSHCLLPPQDTARSVSTARCSTARVTSRRRGWSCRRPSRRSRSCCQSRSWTATPRLFWPIRPPRRLSCARSWPRRLDSRTDSAFHCA